MVVKANGLELICQRSRRSWLVLDVALGGWCGWRFQGYSGIEVRIAKMQKIPIGASSSVHCNGVLDTESSGIQ